MKFYKPSEGLKFRIKANCKYPESHNIRRALISLAEMETGSVVILEPKDFGQYKKNKNFTKDSHYNANSYIRSQLNSMLKYRTIRKDFTISISYAVVDTVFIIQKTQ